MARRAKKDFSKGLKGARVFILGLLFVFLIIFFINRIVSYLSTAPLFTVKEVLRDPALQFIEARYFEGLLGKNIFLVNLRKVQDRILAQYPEVDSLRISRKLPNQIFIKARRREPFAYLKTASGYVLLDDTGMVISAQSAPKMNLPVISGSEGEGEVVLGRPLKSRHVLVGLAILRAVAESQHIMQMRVSAVNVGNLFKIHLRVNNDFDVYVDQDRIPQKIKQLGIILGADSIDFKNIAYLDLRFKEPILGKKK